jgi:hypothetical protein
MAATLGQEEDEQRDEGVEGEALQCDGDAGD